MGPMSDQECKSNWGVYIIVDLEDNATAPTAPPTTITSVILPLLDDI